MAKAAAADLPDGMSIPDELALREERLKKLALARARTNWPCARSEKLALARAKIEARARERHARELAAHEARRAAREAKAAATAREAKAAATGKKPGGKPPPPPREEPLPSDQITLTDEE